MSKNLPWYNYDNLSHHFKSTFSIHVYFIKEKSLTLRFVFNLKLR